MRLVINQSLFWLVSLVAIFIIYRMRLSFLRRSSVVNIVIVVEIILLIASRFFAPVNGAHGWITLLAGLVCSRRSI